MVIKLRGGEEIRAGNCLRMRIKLENARAGLVMKYVTLHSG